jgi:excisionase family DNA binding protein
LAQFGPGRADEFFTVDEIATQFKVDQQTVRNWIDDGALNAIRIGPRRVRVRQSDLEAYIDPSSTANAPDLGEARTEFADALEAVQREGGADDEAAVRLLARAAHRLALALQQD